MGDIAYSHHLMNKLLQIEFPGEHVKLVMSTDEGARRALRKLDIHPADHAFLADILDPQNDGLITIMELVNGMKRLRGDPRRSDIIAIDLMVRSLQERVDEVWKWTFHANHIMKQGFDAAEKRSQWSKTLQT